MRESRTYGSGRGACHEMHVPTATCARQSWCDPAGGSPAQVRSSVRLVASVAWPLATVVAKAYTAIAWGVGLSHERSDIAGAEGFHSLEGNMCGTVMRGADALPGSRPHHVQRDRIGTWEVSGLAVRCCVSGTVRIG